MKLYNFLFCVVMLCAFVSAKKVKKSAEYPFPEKINEDSELFIVDVNSAHHRFNLDNCRFIPSKLIVRCEFEKILHKYKYRIDLPIINEPECEFNKDTKIVQANLWSMVKDTNVFKFNNEIKTEGKAKVLTTQLYRAQHFQLTTNQEKCVFKAEFNSGKITRI